MEEYINEEIYTGKAPIPITIEGTEKILSQMKKCVCKIHKKIGQKGTGFFCKIPIGVDAFLPVLITNYHVLNDKDIENNSKIEITINNDKELKNITIDKSRKKYFNKKLDITFIEIKPQKDKIEDFLCVDADINKDENILKKLYEGKSIYVLHYPKGEKINVSYGLSIEKKKEEIYHYCNTEEGSSGAPILSLDTFEVIGVHKGAPKYSNIKMNVGTLIKNAIEDFIDNIYNKNNNTAIINDKTIYKKLNEITIVYKLGDFDNELKLFGEEFVKNNKEKCILIINDKEHKLCEKIERSELLYIKKNIVKIKLKEIQTIIDMSYMFDNCSSLVDLPDISEWDTSYVNNMKCMFDSCEGLISLPDISKWNTSNVKNMNSMFKSCYSINTLPDISNWKTTSLLDYNDMFLECKDSLNIPLKFKNN